jgi:hypothetical protein
VRDRLCNNATSSKEPRPRLILSTS